MFDFKVDIYENDKNNNKKVSLYVFRSNELNISYITNTNKCTFSFNLEYITINEANNQIEKFGSYLDFDYKELVYHPLDYNVICYINKKETNESILESICECFHIKID